MYYTRCNYNKLSAKWGLKVGVGNLHKLTMNEEWLLITWEAAAWVHPVSSAPCGQGSDAANSTVTTHPLVHQVPHLPAGLLAAPENGCLQRKKQQSIAWTSPYKAALCSTSGIWWRRGDGLIWYWSKHELCPEICSRCSHTYVQIHMSTPVHTI